MRTLRLSLFAVLVMSTTLVAACTGSSSDDDDDDGFGGSPTPTLSPTPTGTASPTPTAPPQPITERSSFIGAGGTELWLCFEHQFLGSITAVTTEGAGACDSAGATAIVSDPATPTFTAFRVSGVTGCDANSHDWFMDYVLGDDPRCTGDCVKQYDFQFTAPATFGTLCAAPGVGPLSTVINTLEAYQAVTTGEHRFRLVAGAGSSVSLEKILVYSDGGAALLTECTVTATVASNGTGLIDGACTPNAATSPLTSGVTYEAILFGKAGASGFVGSRDFMYVDPPPP